MSTMAAQIPAFASGGRAFFKGGRKAAEELGTKAFEKAIAEGATEAVAKAAERKAAANILLDLGESAAGGSRFMAANEAAAEKSRKSRNAVEIIYI